MASSVLGVRHLGPCIPVLEIEHFLAVDADIERALSWPSEGMFSMRWSMTIWKAELQVE